MVCDSLMGLGKVITVELAYAGTLTTLPWIDTFLQQSLRTVTTIVGTVKLRER